MTLPVKIYKCTLEILIRSIMWKIQLFFWLEKWNLYYFSIASYTQGKSLSKRTCKLNKEIKETKTWIFNSDSSDKGFKGTVVHRASPSLHLGSLAIKLTVHLKKWHVWFTTVPLSEYWYGKYRRFSSYCCFWSRNAQVILYKNQLKSFARSKYLLWTLNICVFRSLES